MLAILNVIIIRGMRTYCERRKSLHPKRSCVSVNSTREVLIDRDELNSSTQSHGRTHAQATTPNVDGQPTQCAASLVTMSSTATGDSAIQLNVRNTSSATVPRIKALKAADAAAADAVSLAQSTQEKQYAESKVTALMIVITGLSNSMCLPRAFTSLQCCTSWEICPPP